MKRTALRGKESSLAYRFKAGHSPLSCHEQPHDPRRILVPFFGVSSKVVVWFSPFFLMALFVSWALFRGYFRDSRQMEILCGLNIAVNLGTTGSYIVAYLW